MQNITIGINQHGYYPNLPKFAAFGHEAQTPLNWLLVSTSADGSGEPVAEGLTRIYRADIASGENVHRVDFSEVNVSGSYTLLIEGEPLAEVRIEHTLYHDLLRDALKYYYLSRAGMDLEAEYAGEAWARSAGHLSDANVTCYSGTDADGKTWEGCDYTLDVSKGWYDAGDYGKYVVNSGISVWTLLNMFERKPEQFADGDLTIPESGNGIPDILDEVRWNMEFMLSMQVPEGEEQAGLVHHKVHSLTWDGFPTLPAAHDANRFLFPVTTAATYNLAATGAQCARIWREFDADFADRCLFAAEMAWSAAENNPTLKIGRTPGQGGGDYGDNHLDDERYWAAAELFITTGQDVYEEIVRGSSYFRGFTVRNSTAMTWWDTAALGTLSLLTVENGLPDAQRASLRTQVINAAERFLAMIEDEGYGLPLTSNGYLWGSNSIVLNNAVVLGVAYDLTQEERFLAGVTSAMDYILGRNALAQSYVTGYGERAPQYIHHRFWANQPERGYPAPPPGVLVGGPNARPDDPPASAPEVAQRAIAKRYIDHSDSWSTNEITINWNAPLAWVSAFLTDVMGE